MNTFVLRQFGAAFQKLMHHVETTSETFQQKWQHRAYLVNFGVLSKPWAIWPLCHAASHNHASGILPPDGNSSDVPSISCKLRPY